MYEKSKIHPFLRYYVMWARFMDAGNAHLNRFSFAIKVMMGLGVATFIGFDIPKEYVVYIGIISVIVSTILGMYWWRKAAKWEADWSIEEWTNYYKRIEQKIDNLEKEMKEFKKDEA